MSCGMEAFSAWSFLHWRPMSGCGMPSIHLCFSFHVDEHSSYKVPVEVMCRLIHLFEHEIETTRQLHAHRGNLLEFGVGPQTISEYFVEVTKSRATTGTESESSEIACAVKAKGPVVTAVVQ